MNIQKMTYRYSNVPKCVIINNLPNSLCCAGNMQVVGECIIGNTQCTTLVYAQWNECGGITVYDGMLTKANTIKCTMHNIK
jgi:hypothetical protein